MKPRALLTVTYVLGFTAYFFNGVWNVLLQGQTLVFYLLDAAVRVFFPSLMLGLLIYHGFPLHDLGLRSDSKFVRNTAIAILGLTLPYAVITHFVPFSDPILWILPDRPSSLPGRITFAIYFALTAGVTEEFLFRAIGFCLFGSRPWFFLLTSSVLFALCHWEGGITLVAATTLFGFIAGVLFLRFRNLWVLMIAHSLTDFLTFFLIPFLFSAPGPSHNSQ